MLLKSFLYQFKVYTAFLSKNTKKRNRIIDLARYTLEIRTYFEGKLHFLILFPKTSIFDLLTSRGHRDKLGFVT